MRKNLIYITLSVIIVILAVGLTLFFINSGNSKTINVSENSKLSQYEIVLNDNSIDTISVWNSEGKDMIWLITNEGHSYIEYIPYKEGITDKDIMQAAFLHNVNHYRKLK